MESSYIKRIIDNGIIHPEGVAVVDNEGLHTCRFMNWLMALKIIPSARLLPLFQTTFNQNHYIYLTKLHVL